MKETLGKRLSAHRKRLGLTQDRLAELLGVTAQAVSKWENDQSCPDITMLPKLVEVFGTTTDALLGIHRQEAIPAEVVTESERDEEEPEGFHVSVDDFEFHYDTGRRGKLAVALWVILTGTLLLLCPIGVSLWDVLWPGGLLIYGLFGLYPKFSVFRLCCSLLGGYFLLDNYFVMGSFLARSQLLPAFLLLFGVSLLVNAVRSPQKGVFHWSGKGKGVANEFRTDGEQFFCSTSFGEDHRQVTLEHLSSGSASVSFGELAIDLTGCQNFSEDCRITLECSFGELQLLLPRRCRAETSVDKAFANVTIQGSPDPGAVPVRLICDANFGQILIRYV